MPGLDATTAITINGIQCWDEGVHEHYTRNGSQAQQTLVCAWGDRFKLVTYFLGGSEVVGGIVVGKPQIAYAPFPVLVADEVEVVEGIPDHTGMSIDPTGTVAYKYARLVVTFRSFPLDALDNNNETYDVDFGKQILTPSKQALKFADGKPLPVSKPISIPIINFSETRRNLGSIPRAAIINASTNPLNSAAIFGAPAGTILFDGAKSKIRVLPGQTLNFGAVGNPVPTSGGKINADLTFVFVFNPRGHDKALDVDGTWKQVKTQNGDPLYGSSDLNALFATT